jgi:hypothetical protein
MQDQTPVQFESGRPLSEVPVSPPIQANWFRRRPIPVWIIFAWCTLQLFGVIMYMDNTHYFDAIHNGEVSPFSATLGFLYPLLFFVSGVFLLLLRRVALALFSAYLLWGILKIAGGATFMPILSLALVSAVVMYAWWLKISGTLK